MTVSKMSYEEFSRCDRNKLNLKNTVSYSLDHDVSKVTELVKQKIWLHFIKYFYKGIKRVKGGIVTPFHQERRKRASCCKFEESKIEKWYLCLFG